MEDPYLCDNEENNDTGLTDIMIRTKTDEHHKLEYITCDSDEFDRINENIEKDLKDLSGKLSEFSDNRFVDNPYDDLIYNHDEDEVVSSPVEAGTPYFETDLGLEENDNNNDSNNFDDLDINSIEYDQPPEDFDSIISPTISTFEQDQDQDLIDDEEIDINDIDGLDDDFYGDYDDEKIDLSDLIEEIEENNQDLNSDSNDGNDDGDDNQIEITIGDEGLEDNIFQEYLDEDYGVGEYVDEPEYEEVGRSDVFLGFSESCLAFMIFLFRIQTLLKTPFLFDNTEGTIEEPNLEIPEIRPVIEQENIRETDSQKIIRPIEPVEYEFISSSEDEDLDDYYQAPESEEEEEEEENYEIGQPVQEEEEEEYDEKNNCDSADCTCPQKCIYLPEYQSCGCSCFEGYKLSCNQHTCDRIDWSIKDSGLNCNIIGDNWFEIDGKCYWVSDFQMEYHLAQEFCATAFTGRSNFTDAPGNLHLIEFGENSLDHLSELKGKIQLAKMTSRRQNFFLSDRYEKKLSMDPNNRESNKFFDPLWIDRESYFYREKQIDKNSNQTILTRNFYSPIDNLKRNDCLVTNWDYIGHLRKIACDDSDQGYYSFRFACEVDEE